jgi:hypothetical protein
MLLIVGLLSFNGGSLGTITNTKDGATVARAMINTLLGASGSSVVILSLTKVGLFGPATWNFGLTLNAAITGTVIQKIRSSGLLRNYTYCHFLPLLLILFICGIFNDAVSGYGYMD